MWIHYVMQGSRVRFSEGPLFMLLTLTFCTYSLSCGVFKPFEVSTWYLPSRLVALHINLIPI